MKSLCFCAHLRGKNAQKKKARQNSRSPFVVKATPPNAVVRGFFCTLHKHAKNACGTTSTRKRYGSLIGRFFVALKRRAETHKPETRVAQLPKTVYGASFWRYSRCEARSRRFNAKKKRQRSSFLKNLRRVRLLRKNVLLFTAFGVASAINGDRENACFYVKNAQKRVLETFGVNGAQRSARIMALRVGLPYGPSCCGI